MLSVLIPTYNYNIFPLVAEIKKQCDNCKIEYEIICLDDSSKLFHNENNEINKFPFCSYTILPKNIGRSSIRNLLAKKAIHPWLLFLDADVFPKSPTFIQDYLIHINNDEKAVNGGIEYTEKAPEKAKLLRWVYGTKREALSKENREKNPYLSFLTLNFMIRKSVFEKVWFNESIPNFRHEDTLFSYELKKNNITVEHIQNPVYHFGLDPFDIALQKENESIIALKYLMDHHLVPHDYSKMSKTFHCLKKFRLCFLFKVMFFITKPLFIKNLSSGKPSLFVFDLYRLGYICSLKN